MQLHWVQESYFILHLVIIGSLDKNRFKRNNGYKTENNIRQSWLSSLTLASARFIVALFLLVYLLWKFLMILPITNCIAVVSTLFWWKSQLQEHQIAYEEWTKCIFCAEDRFWCLECCAEDCWNCYLCFFLKPIGYYMFSSDFWKEERLTLYAPLCYHPTGGNL